ncbi:MAG: hypothetical protein HKN68_10760 [Saprospiraceae bacterium]|nr:hypothetical protein [Saprospiraceae bacterium]
MKNLLLILSVFFTTPIFSQNTCPTNLRIAVTTDDMLTLQDAGGLDCVALGTALTMFIDGETYTYSLIACGGMEATYSLDAGNVTSFSMDEEIIILFGDGSEGTYVEDGINSAILQSCIITEPATCPLNFRIAITTDDMLTFMDTRGVNCNEIGTALTLEVGGETFMYSLIVCGGMEATFSLDAGNVSSFQIDEEIVITFEDGSVGIYTAESLNSANLDNCMAPDPIPTISQWGIILLFLLGAILGIVVLNSRRNQIYTRGLKPPLH